jgi:3-hydroxybutyryl-CoA dehydrogenase
VWVSTKAARRQGLLQLLKDLGAAIETGAAPSAQALIVVAPLGLDVTTAAVLEQIDPARTVGIDLLVDDAAVKRRVLAVNPATRADMRDAAWALFARDGKPVSVIRDSGGMVTQRVLATIVNIAADMCQQRVCSPQDLDIGVMLGLGYPNGPLAWGDKLGPANVLEVLMHLQLVYGDMRYRPSPWLRRRAALGLSLSQEEN